MLLKVVQARTRKVFQ